MEIILGMIAGTICFIGGLVMGYFYGKDDGQEEERTINFNDLKERNK